ncbi:MAG: AAA family ATPase, partial [Candidatus Omnitrophica bacterium]|nr:AAA family ATPase [Candidatus Omnitrophota bacterium]
LIRRAAQAQRPLLLYVDNESSIFTERALGGLDGQTYFLSISSFTKRQELLGMYVPKLAMSAQERENIIGIASANAPGQIKEALTEILQLQDEEKDSHYQEWLSTPYLQNDDILRQAIATYIKHKYNDKAQGDWREFMQWRGGIITKLTEEASKPENKDKHFYLVFENISSCPERVRPLLNPVLLEKRVEVPEEGRTLKLPRNLHLVFTMHKDTSVNDDSFMNRPLVHSLPAPSDEDVVKLLIKSAGVENATANTLLNHYQKLNGIEFSEPAIFSLHDLLAIASRIRGRASEYRLKEKDILDEEAYFYLSQKLSSAKDINELRSKLFPGKFFTPKIEIKEGEIFFNGVGVKMPKYFLEFCQNNPDKSPAQLFREFKPFGFVVTDLEINIFAQLLRAYKYAGRVVQLEGPSGEGKSKICRVFTHLIGNSLREFNINSDTDLAQFRGQMRPTRDGKYKLYEPPYLTQVSEPGNTFLFNEINTNQENGLYFWLFPEITGCQVKHLPEFAQLEAQSQDDIVKRARIDQNNLWLFTVNPDYSGREAMPSRIASHIEVFRMASPLQATPQICRSLFEEIAAEQELSINPEKYTTQIDALAKVHMQIKEENLGRQEDANQHLVSRQDVTRRSIIRVIEEFLAHEQRMSNPAQAMREAIDLVYVYSWKEPADLAAARQIVEKQLPNTRGLTARQALAANLARGGHALIFVNAANSQKALKVEVRKAYGKNGKRQVQIHDVPIGLFHHKRQLIGGFIPSSDEAQYQGKWQGLVNFSSNFAVGLGVIPQLIRRSRLNPDSVHIGYCSNYTHLDPQVAPILNEFLQADTGAIEAVREFITPEVTEELFASQDLSAAWFTLRREYSDKTGIMLGEIKDLTQEQKQAFAEWFYTAIP